MVYRKERYQYKIKQISTSMFKNKDFDLALFTKLTTEI